MNIFKHLLAVGILLGFQPANAFDGFRSGFMVGLGAGYQTIDVDYSYFGLEIASESYTGPATSLKIGGGVSDQFLLYYVRNASWYTAPSFDGFQTKDVTVLMGISGLGGTYYFSPEAPSVYILGAFGLGDFAAPLESDIEDDTGGAVLLGGGYEISDRVHLEATILSTDIESSDDSNLHVESSSIQVTFNYLWY